MQKTPAKTMQSITFIDDFLCPSFQILLSFLLFSTAMQSRSVESCSNYPGLKRESLSEATTHFF